MTQNTTGQMRKLFDAINIPLLAFVTLCFFLPLCELRCASVVVDFTGVNMALGVRPDELPRDARRELQRQEMPVDYPLVLMPLLALGALALVVLTFLNIRAVPKAWLAALPAALTLLLLVYAIIGFGVEREVARAIKESRSAAGESPAPVSAGKTVWFWLALIASAAATVLAATREKSPPLPARRPVDPPNTFPNRMA